ncbi:rhomboid family intramembrane serine protease [Mucilaginibacter boryungensis]|uniref:Rhomboid family intramembrane serine protease n=2 Tax=Mucilaginibacter boryungensis TaxID=768480 RepID=A0ABR9XD33_9SPHI|nr:rhomboid family intramembrane serine protease [Mucilaginibacter boryungensis]MBE9665100.1 rhomboid family intramembrane serine protease [Mucilaginibacter boryungensis]
MEYLTLAPVASAIFVITLIISLLAFSSESLMSKLILHPYSIYRGEKTYTIITSGFIHKDWTHLIFNMISYFFFAFRLEAYLGHWQFALLYMVSLVFSDLPSIVKHKDDYWYHSLGASGAISAVIFSGILFDPRSSMYIMFLPIPIPSWLFGILYLVYCWYASKQSRDAINHDAHFFGAISGIFITIILYHQIIPHFLQQFGL